MDRIQLKLPPDQVTKVADAIERDLDINQAHQDAADLREILVWLRYRVSRWNTNRPTATGD